MDIERSPGVSLPKLTPTPIAIANVDATSSLTILATRVGDMVQGSFTITVDPTATGYFEVEFPPPIPSNFSAGTDAGGTMATALGDGGKVVAVTGSKNLKIQGNASSAGSLGWGGFFSYLIR